MKRIPDALDNDFKAISAEVHALEGFSTAEEVARAFISILYDYFRESIVLLRLFATVPFGELPSLNREFIVKRGIETKTSKLINDGTPVLSLLGTRGRQDDWNDRRKSRGFLGIPLSSGAFVASLPMLSKLFREMAFDLKWIDEWNTRILSNGSLDEFSGMFHVGDARTAKDGQGRMIIPAREFVMANNVQTVFGCGSGYASHPTLVTVFAFTSELLDVSMTRQFAPLVEAFKSVSSEQIRQGRIFLDG